MIKNGCLISAKTTCPDEFAEWVYPAAGNIKMEGLQNGKINIRLSLARFHRVFLFIVNSDDAPFIITAHEEREFVALTLPMGRAFKANVEGSQETFSGNNAHLLSPQNKFTYHAPNESQCLVCNIHRDVVSDYALQLNLSTSLSFSRNRRVILEGPYGSALQSLLYYLASEAIKDNTLFNNTLFAKELEGAIISAYLLAVCEAITQEKKPGNQIASPAIKKVEDYLSAHLTEPFSLTRLVEISGLPVRTLSRHFKNCYGTSPQQFLKMRRLEAAQRELSHNSTETLSVTTVAYKYGFSTPGRFAKEYRELYHETPLQTLHRRGRT